MLYRWTLKCADRETGAESVVTINAPTQQAAIELASDRGLITAAVLSRSDGLRAARFESPAEVVLIVFGCIALVIGLCLIAYSWIMETTVAPDPLSFSTARSYNIGLLNKQLVVFGTGSVMALCGVVLIAAGRVAQVIQLAARSLRT